MTKACRPGDLSGSPWQVLRRWALRPWAWGNGLTWFLAAKADADLIAASGLFDRDYYFRQGADKRYLSRRFPELHYVARGEEKGLLPCRLFDPRAYRRRMGEACEDQNAFAHYLRFGIPHHLAPREDIDAAWYMACNPDAAQAPDILSHLVTVAIQENRPALPLIDMRAINALAAESGRPAIDVLEDVLAGRLDCPGCYRGLEELDAAQRAYLAGIQVTRLRPRPATPRRNLVFVQAGRRFQPWRLPAERSWDLCLNWYDDGWRDFTGEADFQYAQRGTKSTAVTKIAEMDNVFADYEHVWLLDDDLSFPVEQADTLFDIARRHRLDLLQPCLSGRSHGNWEVLYHRPGGPVLRYTNAVEIMMPLLSNRLMRMGLPYFRRSISGFGLDLLLSRLAGGGLGRNIAVANDIAVDHLSPINLEGGAYYRHLRDNRINPFTEYYLIARTYGTDTTFRELPEPPA